MSTGSDVPVQLDGATVSALLAAAAKVDRLESLLDTVLLQRLEQHAAPLQHQQPHMIHVHPPSPVAYTPGITSYPAPPPMHGMERAPSYLTVNSPALTPPHFGRHTSDPPPPTFTRQTSETVANGAPLLTMSAQREADLLQRIAALEDQNRLLAVRAAMSESAHQQRRPSTTELQVGGGGGQDSPNRACSPAPGSSLYAKRSTRSASIEIRMFEEHMAKGEAVAQSREKRRDAGLSIPTHPSSGSGGGHEPPSKTRPSPHAEDHVPPHSPVWRFPSATSIPSVPELEPAAESKGSVEEEAHRARSASVSSLQAERARNGHAMPRVNPPAASSAAAKKASFRLLRADSRQCEYSHVGNGRISLGVRSTNLVRLRWTPGNEATNVLIIKKPGDAEVSQSMVDVALWLRAHGKSVWVEPTVLAECKAEATRTGADALPFLVTWHSPSQLAQLHLSIDLIVCLGGDGTLLWASNLFKTSVPPVISFAMGSLGFLSPFPIESFPQALAKVFEGGFHLTLRSRLVCTIVKGKASLAQGEAKHHGVVQGPQHPHPQAPVKTVSAPVASVAVPSKPALSVVTPTSAAAAAAASSAAAAAAESVAAADNLALLAALSGPRGPLSKVKQRHYSLSAAGGYKHALPLDRDLDLGSPLPEGTGAPSEPPSPPSTLDPSARALTPDASVHLHAHSVLGGGQGVGVTLIEGDEAGEQEASAAAAIGSLPSSSPPSTRAPSTSSPPPPPVGPVDELAADDVESYVCMNEVIMDRGLSAYLTLLDCFVDGMLFTRVQADGIIVGTPTGSTAYSLSAGGSMCHPEVPCMLFTPVCPHSLSFRPLLFPDTSTLQIRVSPESRGTNCASFDGRHRAELQPGDSLLISMSRWPLPSICSQDGTTDWFDGVRSVLQWNSRTGAQKTFNPATVAAIAASQAAAKRPVQPTTAVGAAPAAATVELPSADSFASHHSQSAPPPRQ